MRGPTTRGPMQSEGKRCVAGSRFRPAAEHSHVTSAPSCLSGAMSRTAVRFGVLDDQREPASRGIINRTFASGSRATR
jgi:hypothetical protein